MERLFWCSEKKVCSWDHKTLVWVLTWPFYCCVSLDKLCDLSVSSFLPLWWESYHLPHRLMGGWNDIMHVKILHKCETVHRRDTRMTRVMVSSEVCAGTYLGCFLALLGSPGPTHLIWGREIWRCVSRGLGVLRTLRNNRDTREGIQFRFFLYTDLE